MPVLSLVYGPDRTLGLIVKRVIDIAIAAARARPPEPAVHRDRRVWIRLVDGPPVLFRQVRVGLHGRRFPS